jgi:hypothetical protein
MSAVMSRKDSSNASGPPWPLLSGLSSGGTAQTGGMSMVSGSIDSARLARMIDETPSINAWCTLE